MKLHRPKEGVRMHFMCARKWSSGCSYCFNFLARYQQVLNEIHQCYLDQRELLLGPSIASTVTELTSQNNRDHCALVGKVVMSCVGFVVLIPSPPSKMNLLNSVIYMQNCYCCLWVWIINILLIVSSYTCFVSVKIPPSYKPHRAGRIKKKHKIWLLKFQ